MRRGGRIGDFEAAFLEIVTVVKDRAENESRAFWIHDDIHIMGTDEKVALYRTIDKIHFVLKTGTSATDDGEAQRAVRPALAVQEGMKLFRRLVGQFAKLVIAKFDPFGEFNVLFHRHKASMRPAEGRRNYCLQTKEPAAWREA